MATNRAKDAARQLKDDIKNSIRIPSRSRERTTAAAAVLDLPLTNTMSGTNALAIF